jgi:hypothetical protein
MKFIFSCMPKKNTDLFININEDEHNYYLHLEHNPYNSSL